MGKQENKNVNVQIAGRIGASLVALVAINLIFAKDYAWVSIFIVLIMVIFGIILASFENKKKKEK
ncbi:MAG: hypothetical protein WCF78_03140 [archaeon]